MENMFSSFPLQGFGFPSSWCSFEEGVGLDGMTTATVSSSKSHSEAEKRRRDRINGQLQTLRKLTPKSENMDKAALLANVIHHVNDLKTKAAELRQSLTIPSDTDELHISSPENNSSCVRNMFIEVSMCCEDRPELFPELEKVLQSLKLAIVQAEMASVGSRVQIILILSSKVVGDDEDLGLLNLRGKLKASLNRIVYSSPSLSSYRVASKRQRFFFQQG